MNQKNKNQEDQLLSKGFKQLIGLILLTVSIGIMSLMGLFA